MDKWMNIVIRWCLGAMLLILLMTLGLDANTVTWLIVYAGVFFACWGIGNVLVAAFAVAMQRWEKAHD